MEETPPRPSRSNNNSYIVEACIIAVGLYIAAQVVSYRSPTLPDGMPHISQSSVGQQFRSQVMASPALHTFRRNKITATLTDVTVSRVTYSPKDDAFEIMYAWVCQPSMENEGIYNGDITLINDGYGNYFAKVENPGESDQSADITLR